jgi:hypothetical protein
MSHAMKKTLRLRREALTEITASELPQVRGGTTPFATDGHHCFGSSLCFGISGIACATLQNECTPPPNSLLGC